MNTRLSGNQPGKIPTLKAKVHFSALEGNKNKTYV